MFLEDKLPLDSGVRALAKPWHHTTVCTLRYDKAVNHGNRVQAVTSMVTSVSLAATIMFCWCPHSNKLNSHCKHVLLLSLP